MSPFSPLVRGLVAGAASGRAYDRIQKGGTVGIQLARADAADLAQCRERAGLDRRHLTQRRIVEDDVRRHALRLGEVAAYRAQRIEQGVFGPAVAWTLAPGGVLGRY